MGLGQLGVGLLKLIQQQQQLATSCTKVLHHTYLLHMTIHPTSLDHGMQAM